MTRLDFLPGLAVYKKREEEVKVQYSPSKYGISTVSLIGIIHIKRAGTVGSLCYVCSLAPYPSLHRAKL